MLLESLKNSSIKGSDILWSIFARKKVIETVEVTVKENEQEIKRNN